MRVSSIERKKANQKFADQEKVSDQEALRRLPLASATHSSPLEKIF